MPRGKKINFCLYARKSSESDELQALSIDSQINEMMAIAERSGLKVVTVFKESHSAKDSGERPVFRQMIEDIKLDKVQGILTWAPDRLSRNAGDLGILVDFMDQDYLLEIRTFNQVFTNSPNDKFLLMILGSQAKLENDNKAINVKRGLKVKCEMGFRPGVTPLGYINNPLAKKGERKIYFDPIRAPLLKEAFVRVASGQSGRSVFKWLNEQGFTTKSGKKLALSTLYNILENTYYYGKFEYPIGSGNWYTTAHEPLITEEIFNQARENMAVAPRPKPGVKEFNFTKILKCGSCGSGVCAEEKFKTLKNGSRNRYVYYHCSGGADRGCKELYIREEDLLNELLKIVDKLDINKLDIKKKLHEEVARYKRFTVGILQQEADLPYQGRVNIREYAKYILKNGQREEKREILSCLKTNLYLRSQKVEVTTTS